MDDDGDDKDDTKRRTRNLSEKKRRDQFNMLVNELSTMISSNNRKMDKSTVLKSTISFLKNHNEVTVRSRAHDVQEDWKPAFLANEEFTYLVLEALEGFVMVFSIGGQIYYVSESIASLLGHDPGDIVNKSIYDLASDEDRPNLYNLLQNPSSTVDPMQILVKENKIRFQCNLRRGALDFREETTYELIEFNGHFRTNVDRAGNDDVTGYPYDQKSKVIFVCTCRLYTPQLIRDVSLVDSDRNEFTSRHSLEWKFLFLDHRAPPIIGYLPFEVLGTSGYDYYHFDDLEKVVTCHEALMRKGELTSCYYRFLTKGQQWIWLQTRFYITYHQWNSKPEFVVCMHRVVSYADIANGTKQEGAEAVDVSEIVNPEVELNQSVVKEQPAEDAMVSMSPTYISESGDGFSNNFQPVSQPASVKSASACSTATTVTTKATKATAGTSWLRSNMNYTTGGSDTASISGESRNSQQPSHTRSCSGSAPRAVYFATPKSPPDCGVKEGVVERLKEVNPVPISYAHAHAHVPVSCDGLIYQEKSREALLVPQHGIGAQYLEPAPYVGVSVGLPGVGLPGVGLPGVGLPGVGLPGVGLPGVLPVIVSPDQAQMQEQLQRKHEQLRQMIVRQQEELRQVKEELLLARLGMIQPIVNVPSSYMNREEMQQGQRHPAQMVYDGSNPRTGLGLYAAPPPPPPQPQPQPPPPPNASRHPHMPQ